jgi:hypothetical protein
MALAIPTLRWQRPTEPHIEPTHPAPQDKRLAQTQGWDLTKAPEGATGLPNGLPLSRERRLQLQRQSGPHSPLVGCSGCWAALEKQPYFSQPCSGGQISLDTSGFVHTR